jgi:uncharacterized protein
MYAMARVAAVGVAVAGLAAAPAAAQFTDAYNFLKAVKDKDGGKATEFLDKPGTTIVNVRDSDSGDTALLIAARRQDDVWIGFLVQRGADINARDRQGYSALMLAAGAGWSEGVRILVALRTQLDQQNRIGETALALAIQKRDAFVTKQLLDAGANPDITDNSGASARSIAESDPRGAALARLLKEVPVKKARPVQGPSL